MGRGGLTRRKYIGLAQFLPAGPEGFTSGLTSYDKPRRADPWLDLDLASYGVVAILEPDSGRATGAQVPKEAFAALAGHRT